MAINPPSDLILDVLKAADPVRSAAAEQRLSALRAAHMEPSGDFAASLEATRPDFAAADARARLEAVGPTIDKAARQRIDFEAMILASFVGEIMPKSKDGPFSSGFAGDMWRSVMADQIARQIAKSGSIGIAKHLFATHALSDVAMARTVVPPESDAAAPPLARAEGVSAND